MKTIQEFIKQKNSGGQIDEALNIEGINETGLKDFNMMSLNLVTKFHLFHLVTKKAQEHIAIGAFYNGLNEKADKLSERFITAGGDMEVPYSRELVISVLKDYREQVNSMLQITNRTEMASIYDELVDLQELIDDTIYQLDLL